MSRMMRCGSYERLQCLLPISHGVYLEPFPLQGVQEHLLDRRLIVHQKYPARRPLYALHHRCYPFLPVTTKVLHIWR